ncbi:MAG: hypothetical protein WBJ13_13150 [Sedimentibacter sp.]
MKFFLDNIAFIRRLIIIILIAIIIVLLMASRCSSSRIRMFGNIQTIEVI